MNSSLPLQLVKECVGTVMLAQVRDNFDITCTVVSGPFCVVELITGWVVEHPLDQIPTAPSRAEKGPPTLVPPSPEPQVSRTGSAIP